MWEQLRVGAAACGSSLVCEQLRADLPLVADAEKVFGEEDADDVVGLPLIDGDARVAALEDAHERGLVEHRVDRQSVHVSERSHHLHARRGRVARTRV